MRIGRAPVILIFGFALGVAVQAVRTHAVAPPDETLKLYGRFVDAVEQVAANYVREVSRDELLNSALRGMLAELDPYSSFFDDPQWKQFQKQIEGSFTGIGVQIDFDRRTGRPMVLAPVVGSPAYAAGILGGDLILEIDGAPTEDWDRQRVVDALTGPPGTEVRLKVKHPDVEEPVELTIRRAVIALDSVLGDHRKPEDDTWDFFLDRDAKLAYIRITTFGDDTAAALRRALQEIQSEGAKGLILDLRDNPGGLLSAAVEISELFLSGGRIVSTKGRAYPERSYDAKPGDVFEDLPMVVLINGQSASASEIVASALQDHKRATIVGQRSFGKGTVQGILPLEEGDSRLRLTVATYHRPNGHPIHRFKNARPSDEWGVSPDEGMEVRLTDEQYVRRVLDRQRRDRISRANQLKPEDDTELFEIDPQLAKAVEVLRHKIDEAK
ncbi:MAG: hypothetical protein KatS3mg108_1245 [Isosphaeraceae bacterium]|jgi:carboxyl-terminal processing protease|nr:MAG: hypothetical protein KatS3mg108_1245 [Isosphaeraceae bacterium]